MTRAEECRHDALAWLAARPAVASSEPAILRGVNREGATYSEAELRDALALLRGLDLVRPEPDPLGSTLFWQITAAGTLAYERGLR